MVAECLDAEMPTGDPWPTTAVALREASPRAAPRRALYHRGGGDDSFRPRTTARYCRHPQRLFHANAGEVPGRAEQAAVACTEIAAKTGFSPPQAGVSRGLYPCYRIIDIGDQIAHRRRDQIGDGRFGLRCQ